MEAAREAGRAIVTAEASSHRADFAFAHADHIGKDVIERLSDAQRLSTTAIVKARRTQAVWRKELTSAFRQFDYLVIPTLRIVPPRLDEVDQRSAMTLTANTLPISLAGFPVVAIPIPSDRELVPSLQIFGPPGSEGNLLGAAKLIEQVARSIKARGSRE